MNLVGKLQPLYIQLDLYVMKRGFFPLPQPIHYASVVPTAPKALSATQGSELHGPALVETVSLVNAHWLPMETQVKAPKCNSTGPRGAQECPLLPP